MAFDAIPWDRILEILGFSVGLLYLWWEYHADYRLWYASIVMPFISMWIYLSKGIYADFAINIYYLLIAVYGWWVWRHGGKRKDKREAPITHIHGKILWVTSAAALLIWGAIYWGLKYLTDSTVPLADSFTTALSIVGTWMLARKYIEQWIVWILVDAVCVGLYIYKGIYFYGALYCIYTVIAFFGYKKWQKDISIHSSSLS